MESNGKPHHFQHDRDIDRLIVEFGQKPPEQSRQRLHEELAWQKEKFLVLERIRHRERQRRRGRSW